MADINVKGVNKDKKRKALFYLSCKGSNLSIEVKKLIDKYAEEFEKIKKWE